MCLDYDSDINKCNNSDIEFFTSDVDQILEDLFIEEEIEVNYIQDNFLNRTIYSYSITVFL